MSTLLLLGLAAGPIEADVIEQIFARQAVVAAQVCSLSYLALYQYRETDYRQDRRQEVSCFRRVTMRGYDNQRHDFLRVTVDGRELVGEEMEQEISDLRAKGLIATGTRMPFLLETRNEYRYQLLGTTELAGQDCWLVGFEPVRPSGRTVRGQSFVLRATGDIIRTEFRPARVPFVVQDIGLVLEYGRVGSYWLPSRFTFRMDLRLRLLVTMLDRRIEVDDSYTDYHLYLGEASGNE